MLTLIGLAATAAIGVLGYFQTRAFVRRRLVYVDAVQRGAAPFVAALGAALVALPVVALVPLIGGGTAVVFGVAVGAGLAAGARDVRRRLRAG